MMTDKELSDRLRQGQIVSVTLGIDGCWVRIDGYQEGVTLDQAEQALIEMKARMRRR